MAGVSSATVSRAFNKPQTVSPELVHSVMQAADELGYRPDRSASSLRRSNNGIVLVISNRMAMTGPTWQAYSWHWAETMRGIQQEVQDSLYHLQVAEAKDADEVGKIIGDEQWAGILVRNWFNDSIARVLVDSGITCLFCGDLGRIHKHRQAVAQYTGDNVTGGRLAAEYLHNHGHSRVALVTCDKKWQHVLDNRKGFLSVFPDARVLAGGYDSDWGATAARQLRRSIRAKTIDAVFTYNSWTGVGLIRQLMKDGFAIPDDVSVMCYDRSPLLEVFPFSVATIDSEVQTIFRKGCQSLLQLSQSDAGSSSYHEHHPPRLVPGESVAKRR